jgi:hypothetical protein
MLHQKRHFAAVAFPCNGEYDPDAMPDGRRQWTSCRNRPANGLETDVFLRRPYSTVGEFYQAVGQLSVALKANGKTTEAERLDGVMRCAWTTSSELIGELMLALAAMDGDFPAEIRKQVKDCLYFARHHRRILGLD